LKVAGVIDPVKVGRIALENAASIAGMVLTTACAITEKPEKKSPAPPMGGGYDEMM
ncbi:MAG: chaperonin GroEL, partial [Bacteroidota bacterium]